VRWRLAHSDVVGAAELIGGRLIVTSINGDVQAIDPDSGKQGS